ncbi:MAG: SBBP repeat-containing protein, partial [Bryobacteraceae bacterium]
QSVAGAFAVHGRRVTFAIGAYDHARELVIDPTLTYATYLGGSDNESSRGIAVDASGNFYVTGFTFSLNLPVTSGAFQTAYHGGSPESDTGGDAFVAKYTPAGALVYLTYLGGGKGINSPVGADDVGDAIAVDSAGNVYVTGYTSSLDFPTVKGSYQTTFGGQTANQNLGPFGDAFVAKLNPTGTALVYSTYLGGNGDDRGTAIAVDSKGNAYVGGDTLSTNFPTLNPYQSSFKGSGGSPPLCSGCGVLINFGDGFVSELNAAGTALVFSTYLGGALDDSVTAIALDGSGNVYVGGATLSSDFPTTLNAYQSKYGGAASDNNQPVLKTGDGFVAKFDATGKLVYSTYLGGSGDDAVMGLAVDSTGAAYVTGFTSSANFPVSATAAQKTFGGPPGVTGERGFVWGDAFVAKLAPSGSSLVWATYLGGNQDDAGMAIAVDSSGSAIVGGFANSTNLAVTSTAQQKTFGGNSTPDFTDPTGDAFLAKVSPDGTSFLYLSYYGGNSSDAITAVALDGQGNVIVGGTTTSTNLPVTANAAQKTFGGENPQFETETMGDAFVAVFSGLPSASATPVITSVLNAGSFTSSLAPGSAAAAFGTNLPTSASAGALVGGQTAQVLLATAAQWSVAIPYNAATGASTVQIGTSAAFPITLSQYAPALFSADGSGQGIVAAERVQTGGALIVSASAPAIPGDTLYIFVTGLGAIDSNGHPSPLPTVTVGGQSVTVVSAVAGSTTPGTYQVTIQLPVTTPSGSLPVVLSIGGASSQSLTLPVGVLTGLVITNAENGASFLPGFSQGSWTTITGANLSGTTRIWTGADFNGANLPTQLDQVSVTVDGKAAYVYYISPTQLNVLSPADTAVGPVPVQVTYAGKTSNVLNGTEAAFAPAMFMFTPLGGKYVAAVRSDGQYLGPTNLYPGLTVPAHAGDVILLYGTGFGPTNPTTDFSQTFSGAPPTANTVTATIGGVPAAVALGTGFLVYPGEYQFNITVPSGLTGDNLVVLKVNGLSTQANAYLTVQ